MKKRIKSPWFQYGNFESSDAVIRSHLYLKRRQLNYCIRTDRDYQGNDSVAMFIGNKKDTTQLELYMSVEETEQLANRLLAIAKYLKDKNETNK